MKKLLSLVLLACGMQGVEAMNKSGIELEQPKESWAYDYEVSHINETWRWRDGFQDNIVIIAPLESTDQYSAILGGYRLDNKYLNKKYNFNSESFEKKTPGLFWSGQFFTENWEAPFEGLLGFFLKKYMRTDYLEVNTYKEIPYVGTYFNVEAYFKNSFLLKPVERKLFEAKPEWDGTGFYWKRVFIGAAAVATAEEVVRRFMWPALKVWRSGK